MDSNTLIENEPSLLQQIELSPFEKQLRPEIADLIKANPPLCEIADYLVARGHDPVEAKAIQFLFEERFKEQRRRAQRYADDLSKISVEAEINPAAARWVARGPVEGNRKQRRKLVKDGDRKRKAREAIHKEWQRRELKRQKANNV